MMKKLIILTASAIVLPFLNPMVNSQSAKLPSENNVNDTLTIKLKENNKVLMVGNTFKDIIFYASEVDAVKTHFLIDIANAYESNSLSKASTQVYYFYNNSSQRRIKADDNEMSNRTVDINYEITRLKLNLPKYRYIIHDLKNEQRWEVYMSSPDSLLIQLGAVSLQQAILTTQSEMRELRKETNAIVTTDSNTYRLIKNPINISASIELNGYIGASVIGNRISPAVGITASFAQKNKFGIPTYKFGIVQTMMHLVDLTPTEIKDLNLIFGYDVFYVRNVYTHSKSNYLGLGVQIGSILDSPKFGVLVDGVGRTNWSFDFILPKTTPLLFSITMRLPF